jgi:hypothetical protein
LAAAAQSTRATGLAALLGFALAWTSPGTAWAQGRSIEYAVKAAYLYKFAPFVEWPPAAFSSASSPFQVCILGRDPFGASLDQVVSGQRVDEHRVVVRRLDRVDAASGCHVLYLGATTSQTAAEALRAVRGSPVLTVAESGRESGAIIKFVVKDNRVRFDIDTAAAAANRVTISSKLLGMAMNVRAGAS